MNALRLRQILCGLAGPVLLTLAGCGPTQSINPWALRKENDQLKVTVRQYQDQLAQAKLQRDRLDEENEQLQTLYAREKTEQSRAKQNTMAIGRSGGRPADPDNWDDEKDYGQARGRQNSGGSNTNKKIASTAKGSGGAWLQLATVQGAEVLRDGDAVRIRVTNTSLFDPGKATLKPGATQVLDRVAAALKREYAGHQIGIEGHTDADPIKKSNWKDNRELSVARAKAVADYLETKGFASNQLYVAGYGPNVPIASNKTAAGKAQNRRVEFVVQPSGTRALADRGGAR